MKNTRHLIYSMKTIGNKIALPLKFLLVKYIFNALDRKVKAGNAVR